LVLVHSAERACGKPRRRRADGQALALAMVSGWAKQPVNKYNHEHGNFCEKPHAKVIITGISGSIWTTLDYSDSKK